ncbi:hypothetical protein BV25DRAFT_1053348 [Artomyces pyxidatus]|uniref:Uncharacterized protein n=1 Tax=Artomyces pyxidatus TaxID=48021 RepID=A0ACB8SV44_9AGAM|nr:hypothetical protein BV25DRAFT_1053348 [Artomyces pyxidatus]
MADRGIGWRSVRKCGRRLRGGLCIRFLLSWLFPMQYPQPTAYRIGIYSVLHTLAGQMKSSSTSRTSSSPSAWNCRSVSVTPSSKLVLVRANHDSGLVCVRQPHHGPLNMPHPFRRGMQWWKHDDRMPAAPTR